MSFIEQVRKQFGDTEWDSDWDSPNWTFAWRHSTKAYQWNNSEFTGTRDEVINRAATHFARHLFLNGKSVEIKIWQKDVAEKVSW